MRCCFSTKQTWLKMLQLLWQFAAFLAVVAELLVRLCDNIGSLNGSELKITLQEHEKTTWRAAVFQLALQLGQFAGSTQICAVVVCWRGCKWQGRGIREIEFVGWDLIVSLALEKLIMWNCCQCSFNLGKRESCCLVLTAWCCLAPSLSPTFCAHQGVFFSLLLLLLPCSEAHGQMSVCQGSEWTGFSSHCTQRFPSFTIWESNLLFFSWWVCFHKKFLAWVPVWIS